jgi:hypothetical protein
MRLLLTLLPLLFIPAGAQPTTPSPGLKYYYPVPPANPVLEIDIDVCVYGGTPAGVSAAIKAARMGRKAALFVFRRHVGGMTSGGLTATDLGSRGAIGGFANEFYARLGKTKDFKPSEAEATFLTLLKEAGVRVYFEHRLAEVLKEGSRITAVSFENGNRVRAKMFVDATYEGDLFARAGVSFHVGRESNATYGESLNGIQLNALQPNGLGHSFAVKVDPYIVSGNPSSGLLPTVSAAAPGEKGSGDKSVQAYAFRFNLRSPTAPPIRCHSNSRMGIATPRAASRPTTLAPTTTGRKATMLPGRAFSRITSLINRGSPGSRRTIRKFRIRSGNRCPGSV